MAESALRRPDRRPLARVPDRACSRPSCPAPAVATLSMVYGDQHSRLTDLTVEASPERYDLCGVHADRTRPPRGWTLDDDRSDDPVVPDAVPTGPRSVDDTVALLAAALRDDPVDAPAVDPVPEVDPAPVRATTPVGVDDPAPALAFEPEETVTQPGAADLASPTAVPVGRRVPAASRLGDD